MNATASTKLFRVGLLGVAFAVALPAQFASAQEMDHSKMQMPMPENKPIPSAKSAAKPAAKPASEKKEKKPKPASDGAHATHQNGKPAPSTKPVMDHAGMGHDMPMPVTSDHAMPPVEGMPMPAADVPVQPTDHSMMDMSMDHSNMPGMSRAPTDPITPIPKVTEADRAAALPPPGGHVAHGNSIQNYTLIDRLEAWNADEGTGLAWEGQAWVGSDLNRVWLRSEGERIAGRIDSADFEVLYGRSVATWWDVVAGVRHDFKPGGSQEFAAIGVMGLAPYKFEVKATAYIGQSGQTAARFEAEYDVLLTNRLILQPLVEVNLYGKDDPSRDIGSGLSTVEGGLRLRYEVSRRFSPYIGIVRERAFGATADFHRAKNETIGDTRFVAGVRIWF